MSATSADQGFVKGRHVPIMRLFVFTLYGVFAFAALIFAARMTGHAQPPPEPLVQLHLTDCALPCWIGIVPGETRFDQAVERVSIVYPQADVTITGQGKAPRFNADTEFGQILISADRAGVVHRISLPIYKLRGIMLADVAGLLGSPTGTVGIHPVTVYYGCMSFQVVISGGTVNGGWRQRPIIIDIQDRGYSCPSARR